MLVLSQKKGQSIMIGEDIIITVLNINQGQVKVGIKAPNSTKIYREELWLKIQANKNK